MQLNILLEYLQKF